jgi:hypothetical protein
MELKGIGEPELPPASEAEFAEFNETGFSLDVL